MGKKSKTPSVSTTTSVGHLGKKTKADTKDLGANKKRGKAAAPAAVEDGNAAGPSNKLVALKVIDEDETEDEDEEDDGSDDEEEAEAGSGVGENDDADDGEDDDGETEDEDDDGVDEEGMERLMRALGEDGLNDFDKAQLESLVGEDEDEETDNEDDSESKKGASGKEDSEEVEEEDGDEDDNEDEEQDEFEDEAIALDDIEGSVDEDAVPQQKIEVDNTAALDRIRETIQLDPSLQWTETLTVTYDESIDVDVNDDLNRELAFYKQALHAANTARTLAAKNKLPFTRPADYFAEMVKTDAHMERIRQRLLDESANIKRSEEKRKEREGKKFGKQVQLEKIKERERSKKDMEERLKSLKRKRKDGLDTSRNAGDDEEFDVAVEDAIQDRPTKRAKAGKGGKPLMSRNTRDKKFGFGGAGRRSKQNTKASTDDFIGGGRKGGQRGGKPGGARGGKTRPGKNRRVAARSRA